MTARSPFPVPFTSTDARGSYEAGVAPGIGLALLVSAALLGYAGDSGAAPTLLKQLHAPAASTQSGMSVVGFARGRLLAIPRAGLSVAEVERELKPFAGRARLLLGKLNAQVIELPAGVDEIAALEKLRKSRKFKNVELDMAVAPTAMLNDPGLANSWDVSKIGAPAAWVDSTGEGVTVAVLDTGVDATHPDLVDNLVPGWNTYDDNADSADVYGHGTMVAGVVAMRANNGIGGAGIAYGAKVMPVRISDPDGYGYFSTIAQGIYWAADHGARVANVSFAGVAGSSMVASAAQYMRSKGGVVVVAAGNSGTDLGYAANDNVIVASATDSSDALASFSSFGAFVDVAAPGVSVYTTKKGGGYGSVSGTSFASPVTAATVALMLGANPDLAAAEVDTLLFSSALDLGAAGRDDRYGYGRVNAAAAVAAAQARVTRDTVAPVVAILAPLGGTVAGIVPVDVSASDDHGVARVDLYLNGQKVVSDTSAPFAFSLDTTAYPDGNATLMLSATDAAGNVANSLPVTLTLANATDTQLPRVALVNSLTGTLSGVVTLAAEASDNKGVARVEFFLNGQKIGEDTTAPYTLALNTQAYPAGNYTLSAKATDTSGNVTSTPALNVSFAGVPDLKAPVVAIATPTRGKVSGTFPVSITASDNVGVARIDLYLNGRLVGSDSAAPYALSLDTLAYANGTYSLIARAVDAAGNTGVSKAVTVSFDNDRSAPIFSSFSLRNGQTLLSTRPQTLTASARDNVRVVRMALSVDGVEVAATASGSLSWRMAAGAVTPGLHLFALSASDTAGNTARLAAQVTVR